MGTRITITVRENSTIEVHQPWSNTQPKIYNNEILRQFNMNRILFDSGRSPFLIQPTIQPPKVVDFINVLSDMSFHFARHLTVDVKKFVNEFVPRLARPGDIIILDSNYRHTRNEEVIFGFNLEELRLARRFYGTKDPPTVVVNEGGVGGISTLLDVTDLLSRIEDYVLNVRRR